MAQNSGRITVSLSELRVGVVLPADVSDAKNSNVLLLRKGTPITQQFLNRLKCRGVFQVTVDAESAAILRRGEGSSAAAPPPKLAPRASKREAAPEKPIARLQRPKTPIPLKAVTRQMAEAKQTHARHLQEIYASAARHSSASAVLATELIAQSVEHITADIDVFLKVALETSESSEVYEHCLAAAQLAMSVGIVERLSEQAIQDLGAGCVLSRIGQSEEATRNAEQMRELTLIEMIDLKRTPSRTFDLLQNMRDISVGARNVAYQIFERFDGSGYPRGRAGSQISPLARVAAVCDVYVALTSPRPHRTPFEPYAAVEMLLQETREGKFDPAAMRGLLRTIGLFPIGSFVRLSNGTVGQVTRNHHDQYDHPVVHLFLDEQANCIKERDIAIDLAEHPEITVESAVSTEFVNELMFQAIAGGGAEVDAKRDPQLCLAFDGESK
jgi:HD-GYP domain-containing protein (c-di-GMP phosphodiesterase class II)